MIWAESKSLLFLDFQEFWYILSVVAMVSLSSYFLRYIRWRLLFFRAGIKIKFWKGFISYLAGFAFTLTPGKFGELVRIRYFGLMGAPPQLTLAAFIYERAFDLLTVLILASFILKKTNFFISMGIFVFFTILFLVICASNPVILNKAMVYIWTKRGRRLSRLIRMFRNALIDCKLWFKPLDLIFCFVIGVVGWGVTALSFVYLCRYLGVELPFFEHFSVYPISILAGAASMIPGGLGSTEATIITFLTSSGSQLSIAILAAAGMRFSTLWFSILLGLSSVFYLEFKKRAVF
jgi:uncharacterized protein (TIRG00374 family)